jgi:hypothetical protein
MEEAPRQKPSLCEEGHELNMTKKPGAGKEGCISGKRQQPNFLRSTVDTEERLWWPAAHAKNLGHLLASAGQFSCTGLVWRTVYILSKGRIQSIISLLRLWGGGGEQVLERLSGVSLLCWNSAAGRPTSRRLSVTMAWSHSPTS